MKLLYVVECIEFGCDEIQMLDPTGGRGINEQNARDYFEKDLGWCPLENEEWYCPQHYAEFSLKEAA